MLLQFKWSYWNTGILNLILNTAQPWWTQISNATQTENRAGADFLNSSTFGTHQSNFTTCCISDLNALLPSIVSLQLTSFNVLCIRSLAPMGSIQKLTPNSHIFPNMPWASLNMQVILKTGLLCFAMHDFTLYLSLLGKSFSFMHCTRLCNF